MSMPCSHLLRGCASNGSTIFHTPGIVDGDWLRHMRHRFYEHRAIACMGTCRQAAQSRTEIVRNRAMPVHSPCSFRRFRTEIIGLRTEAARKWCGNWSRAVRLSQEPTVAYNFCCPNSYLKSCFFFRKISIRPPDLQFFSNLS